jgi:hypothetical protein
MDSMAKRAETPVKPILRINRKVTVDTEGPVSPEVYLVEHVDIDRLRTEGVRDGFAPLEGIVRRLRASKVGETCERGLWLSTAGQSAPPTIQGRRNMDIGTALEPVAVRWLQEDGWEVVHNDRDQWGFLYVLPGGILTGHNDVVMRHPIHTGGEWILGDVKTMNPNNYNLWTRYGTREKMPGYYDQLLIYAVPMKLTRCAIIGVNKSNGEYRWEIMPASRERFAAIMDRASTVLTSPELLPIAMEGRTDISCTYCHCGAACLRAKDDPAFAGGLPIPPMLPAGANVVSLLAHVFELRDENGRVVEPAGSLDALLEKKPEARPEPEKPEELRLVPEETEPRPRKSRTPSPAARKPRPQAEPETLPLFGGEEEASEKPAAPKEEAPLPEEDEEGLEMIL